jgi:TldD protein
MKTIFNQAQDVLLEPAEVSTLQLESILGMVSSNHVDFADLYLQDSIGETWFLEDGKVKDSEFSVDRGFGLRVIQGEKVGFAYADNILLSSLEQAAVEARSIAAHGQDARIKCMDTKRGGVLYQPCSPISSLSDDAKVEFLLELDRYARSIDLRVKKVFVQLSISYDVVMVLNTQGEQAADLRPLVHLSIRVVAQTGDRIEQGTSGGGARDDLSYFSALSSGAKTRGYAYVDKAVHQALINLEARPVPAGVMPVVLGPGWPAVLLHEAVGHGLEADFNRKGSSVFSGRIGERVASSLCTVVDDATYLGARGSLNVDDEGVIGQRTVLIERGVLKGYMTDRHNANLMNMHASGNGRRESYASIPLPRMTTTALMPGETMPEEIISSLEKGIYAVDFSGGQVDITSGKFVFSMSEAYWVEGGKIQYPIKGATLVGDGVDVLGKVSMVGNDLSLDPGIGVCGKDGQSVVVGVGQPTLRVDEITVGGVI